MNNPFAILSPYAVPLVSSRTSKITQGEEALLNLIIIKKDLKKQITFWELEKIYISKVQRKKREWIYDIDKGKASWQESRIWNNERAAMNWLKRSLGSLIQKGYLVVKPKAYLEAGLLFKND